MKPTFPVRWSDSTDPAGPTAKWLESHTAFGSDLLPVAQCHMPTNIPLKQLTAGTPDAIVLQPAAGYVFKCYGIYVVASVLAVGRDIILSIRDGTSVVPIFDSGAGAWASGEAFQVYPVDVSTKMTGAVSLIGPPLISFDDIQYLYADTTLAAAETFDVYLCGWYEPETQGIS